MHLDSSDPLLDRLRDTRRDVVLRLSDKVRSLALGVIGFFWAVTTSKDAIGSIAKQHNRSLLTMAALAVLTLLFDLFQSMANKAELDALLRSAKALGRNQEKSTLPRILHGATSVANALKIVCCCTASLIMLWVAYVGLS